MQTPQDEGDSRPAPAEAEGTKRLGESPLRVELRGGGWPGVIGYAKGFRLAILSAVGGTEISYERIDIKEFFFEHAATCLVVQGMVLQEFFQPDVYFKSPIEGSSDVWVQGPLLLLKGELTPPWDLPLRLKGAVLVRVTRAPKEMSRDELLKFLMRDVLSWGG